ncbi:DUF3889 domain-containing protein [Metabacillus malikii]|uniref:DUF3889 domain-containing protein n=1 Tax=Metabacillus malikii TaxID=1504265 RepID=A0ABT9ZI56_9BACI|nr:DUF3889 domain-containing protein [Metabacillus malikii]MDQ0231959.1 hypothetical protein [Metabacillus malikii]
MKKQIILGLLCLSSLLPVQVVFPSSTIAANKSSWEEVAAKETRKLYPLSQVLFSQKVWDKSKKDISIKQYRLTLREGMEDFAVYTTITYDSNSGKIKNVQVLPGI